MDDLKPQLHYSALSMLWKCGEMYRRRYVENEIIPPAVSMIVGISAHRSAEKNMKNKCTTGELLPLEAVKDIARDAVNHESDNSGITLSEDEVKVGYKKVKGEAIDNAVAFSATHHEKLAPTINPISEDHVEKKWVVTLPDYPVDLAGTIDVEEHNCVRDLKTSGKTPGQSIIDDSDQITAYAMAIYAESKEIPEVCALDYLVKSKSGVKAKTIASTRDKNDFKVFLMRLERSIEVIRKGAFAPTDQGNWWCGPKWCGYATTCPFYRGKKQFTTS